MYEAFITFFGNSMGVPYFLYEYLKNVVMFSEKHQHKIKNVSRFLGESADVGYR